MCEREGDRESYFLFHSSPHAIREEQSFFVAIIRVFFRGIILLAGRGMSQMMHVFAASKVQSGFLPGAEPTRYVHTDLAAQYAVADREHLPAVGKRCFTSSQCPIDVEEYSDRRGAESVSGLTFQKDLTLDHARNPNAESVSASVKRHVGSFYDAVFLKPKRLKLSEICCNENGEDRQGILCNQTAVDKDSICRNETDADTRITFVCSRVHESNDHLLFGAREGIGGNGFSWGQPRHSSRSSNSRNASFLSRARGSWNTCLAHLRESEAVPGASRSSKCIVISPPTSSVESLCARFLGGDAINTKSSPASYVLSSGRLMLEEEERLGRRSPTIDGDFEEYFSSLML